eukprot:TRINITY_DN2954_c0_g1_i2.p3 TRINITY_DN2954_c0_g1~~TRINITY_DN2954_c0_g1_i2.p3  ORF type:complete len:150 (-),score=22.83 TRINITY_DN2954_c0_g1_i2:1136-1540(-)
MALRQEGSFLEMCRVQAKAQDDCIADGICVDLLKKYNDCAERVKLGQNSHGKKTDFKNMALRQEGSFLEMCRVQAKAQDDCIADGICVDLLKKYNDCAERVKLGQNSHGCTPYYNDYYNCLDACAGPRVWKQLK